MEVGNNNESGENSSSSLKLSSVRNVWEKWFSKPQLKVKHHINLNQVGKI